MKPTIRKHAYIRITERSSLKPSDVAKALENGEDYPIGKDFRQHHEHRVIYSEKDNDFYIVVQDYDNGEVVTFLYFDYDNLMRIPPEVVDEVKRYLNPNEDKEGNKSIILNEKIVVVASVNIDTFIYSTKEEKTIRSRSNYNQRIGDLYENTLKEHFGFPIDMALNNKNLALILDEDIPDSDLYEDFRELLRDTIIGMTDSNLALPEEVAIDDVASVKHILSMGGKGSVTFNTNYDMKRQKTS